MERLETKIESFHKLDNPYLIERDIKLVIESFFKDLKKLNETIKYNSLISEYTSFVFSNFSDVKSIKGYDMINGHLVIYFVDNGVETTKVFSLFEKDIQKSYIGDMEMFLKSKQETSNKLIKNLELVNNAIDAIEYIFTKKNKEFFGELNNEKDIIDTEGFGKDLKGKTLLELQKIIDIKINESDEYLNISKSKEIENEFTFSKEKYLKYIVGIGDKYEGGAELFEKKPEQVKSLIKDILKNKTIDASLLYLLQTNVEIDKNNYQSEHVEETYKKFMGELNHQIFEKLKNDKSTTDEEYLTFVKIITGKNEFEIDDNLRNEVFANDVIIHLMYKEGGVIERIKKSSFFKLDDEKIGENKPNEILENTKKVLENKGIGYIDFLQKIGYDDVLSVGDKNYEQLDFISQAKISTLTRFNEKLESKSTIDTNDLLIIFSEIAEETRGDLFDKLSKNFDGGILDWNGKNAKDFGLSGVDEEIFNLFKDINGNGLFNLSDEYIGYAKTGGKIAGIIAVVGVTGGIGAVTSMGIISQGAVIGAVATATSTALFPKGYDTKSELVTDKGSDLVIGVGTGALGGVLLGQVGKLSSLKGIDIETAKLFSKGGAIKSGTFLLDLVGLGIITEAVRQSIISKYFGKEVNIS